jgi:hypothetical protein
LIIEQQRRGFLLLNVVSNQNSNIEEEVSVDILKWLYYENKDLLIKDTEMLQNDITEEFYHYIEDKIEHREVINVAFIGEVAGSKSTSAIACMDVANGIIEKVKKKKIDRFKHIFSDQTEFLRFINTEEEDVAIVIDEFNRMSETGLNASTETVLFDYYSEVFAQKHVHRFSCSPSFVLDKNANVVMEYIGKDENKKVSKFKLMYRNIAEGFHPRCLGCVYVDVSKILEQEYYKRYREKKFKRMALLDKHGVRDIRELEFADIVLKAVNDLKDITRDGTKSNLSDMVVATISRVCRENKRIYSIMTTSEIASRVRNILGLYADLYKTSIKLAKSKNDVERMNINEKKRKINQVLEIELKEEEKRRRIYNDFISI